VAADTDAPTDPVAAAFDALIARLNEHALAADFDRAVRYRAAAISLRDRWAAGQMPRAPRKEAA
jgi:hypothetical protein